MIEKNFFEKKGPFQLNDIIDEIKVFDSSVYLKNFKDDYLVDDVCSLEDLNAGKIACFHNTKYKADLKKAKNGICILKEDFLNILDADLSLILIVSKNPYRTFAQIAQKFYPKPVFSEFKSEFSRVDSSAKIGQNCHIDHFTVVGKNASIGKNSYLSPNVVIGENVELGENCFIEAGVVITNAIVGNNVYIKAGAKIGNQGFGFYMDTKGHVDLPQTGKVLIGNNVQIGANTTIDRGSQKDTTIGNGCRIDNLVQIAHNVEIGDNSVIVSQAGIAGSTKLGKFVVVAGQVGIAGHLKIGNNVQIAAQSGVTKDIQENQIIGGSPATHIAKWRKEIATLRKISQ